MSASAPAPPIRVALAVFLPFAAAYFLSYLYRSINAVISPDLIAEFSLSAADLGLLTSAYFLAFAAFQIPVGILLDRFGPRRTHSTLLLFAAAGALLFSLSASLYSLLVARALIGLGVAAGLMGSIKMFTLWFPLHRLPAVTGWVLFVGGLGAMTATAPVEAALRVTDWRGVFMALAAMTLLASAAIFFIAPERASAGRHESLREQVAGVGRIFASAIFWRLAAASALFQAVNMALQGLWAGPWLADVAGMQRSAVALNLLGLAAATMVGFLFWGVAASRLARYGVTPLALLKGGTALFIAVQMLLAFGVTSGATALWIAFGLFGTAGSLAFTVMSHTFPMAMTGRANTALNLLVFFSAFATQWAFGAIVNLWPVENGRYHPHGYSAAFAVLLALQLAAFAWLLFGARGADKPVPADMR
ncbi:MAG: MFS transporter [Burkholderiales bacterium]